MNRYSVNWEPIHTHPKDGTQFLVAGKWKPYDILPGGTVFMDIACWSTLESRADAPRYLMIGLMDVSKYNVELTHWCPLPEPPEND